MHSSELNHICDFHCHRGALGNVLLQGFLFKVVMHIYIYIPSAPASCWTRSGLSSFGVSTPNLIANEPCLATWASTVSNCHITR